MCWANMEEEEYSKRQEVRGLKPEKELVMLQRLSERLTYRKAGVGREWRLL